MSNAYKQTMNAIEASEQFKAETLLKLENQNIRSEKKRGSMKMNQTKKVAKGLVASLAILAGVFGMMPGSQPTTAVDLTTRIVVDGDAVGGKVAVNIEGTIVEVAEDGMSFKLDNGTWVKVTDETEIGISGPTAAPADEQFFEPTFRVGNAIAGFTLVEGEEVDAYAIYTNWNWEDPIR